MDVIGIVCEYNPFHLGHFYQFQKIRTLFSPDSPIICLMSGNYVQRGAPAMWDKSVRAKAALDCGADLILELPVTCVLRSAEGFASAGVEILSMLGCVSHLCFGSECGDTDMLRELAKRAEAPDADHALHQFLKQGLSYASARQKALCDTHNLLSTPNNILGFEYCRAIQQQSSPLIPVSILRSGDYHALKPDHLFPSATSIRNLYPCGEWRPFVPAPVADVLAHSPWYHISFGERAVLSRLRSLSDQHWSVCAHGSEGLWSKAMKASRKCHTYEEIICAVKSKRYPQTRIQRLLICAYLGISEEILRSPVPYVRILGASHRGRDILRKVKKNSPLSLLTPGETPENRLHYRLDCLASDLFTLFAAPGYSFPCGTEHQRRIQL